MDFKSARACYYKNIDFRNKMCNFQERAEGGQRHIFLKVEAYFSQKYAGCQGQNKTLHNRLTLKNKLTNKNKKSQ